MNLEISPHFLEIQNTPEDRDEEDRKTSHIHSTIALK